MEDEIKRLIQNLEEFGSRSAAMRDLVRRGDEAIPHLIEALQSPFPSVRWAAVRVLGQIGNEDALQAILCFEKDAELGTAATEAIVRLKEKLQREKQPQETEVDEDRTVESHEKTFMDKVVEGTQVQMTVEGNKFELRVPTTPSRGQTVTVYFGARDKEGTGFIAIYTECGRANPKHYEWALRQNAKLSSGAIALRDKGGTPWFVMINKHLASAADVDELRETILELAKKADAIEKALSGVDIA